MGLEPNQGFSEGLAASLAGLSPGQQQAARQLAHLAPAPLPVALLEALGGELASAPARAELVSRGLLSSLEAAPVEALGPMPEPLAEQLRGVGGPSAAERVSLGEALLRLMDEYGCRNPRSWPLMRACLPHAERLVGSLLEPGEEGAQRLGALLHHRLGSVSAAMGLAEQCRAFDEALVARLSGRFGPEHPATLFAQINLGRSLRAKYDYPASRRVHEDAVAALRRVLGPEHPETLKAMASLAVTLHLMEDQAGARQLQEEALTSFRRVLGPDHPETLKVMAALAGTMFSLGDLTAAKHLEERTLEFRRRTLGPEHPETLSSLGCLGLRFLSLQDTGGARRLLEDVVELQTRVLGPEHPHTLNAMSSLAMALMMQGELEEARRLQQQALEVRDRFFGPQHPETTVAAWQLFAVMGLRHDPAHSQALLGRHLTWLLARDPRTLAANQREIQGMLANLVRIQRPRPA